MSKTVDNFKSSESFEHLIEKIQRLTGETMEQISLKIADSKFYLAQAKHKSKAEGRVRQSVIDNLLSYLKIVELSIEIENMRKEIQGLRANAQEVESPAYMEYPYVSAESQAGYLAAVMENRLSELESKLPTMLLTKENESGHHKVFEITNDAMWDGTDRSINRGDKVLCKQLDPEFWQQSLYYRKYLFLFISKKEGFACHQVTDFDEKSQTFGLHSFNPMYGDYRLDISDVLQVYIVKTIVERRLKF